VEPALHAALCDSGVPCVARGEPCASFFQLLGFDVMLDAHATPWLLEVNAGPSLGTEAQLDLTIKGQMLVDMLNVVGVPQHPPSARPQQASSARAHARPSTRPTQASSGGQHQPERDAYAVSGMDRLSVAATSAPASARTPRSEGSHSEGGDGSDGDGSDGDGCQEVGSGESGRAEVAEKARENTREAVRAAAAEEASEEEASEAVRAELVERWTVRLVEEQHARAKETRWRRLLPDAEHSKLLSRERRLHHLAFGT
jgi:hypothetical protein